MQKKKKRRQGKLNRAAGARFELKVRGNLENMGWAISRWMNTIDYEKEGKIGKLVSCRPKFNPFTKSLMMNTSGFPDFVAFKVSKGKNHEVIGVEVKRDGYLDQIEKGMCYWYLENKIFSKILIAKKGKKRGEIEYVDFKKKYKK